MAFCPLSTHSSHGRNRPIAVIDSLAQKLGMKTFEGRVRVKLSAPTGRRAGELGWVIDTIGQEDRPQGYLAEIPAGTVYFVEFADGKTDAIHEGDIEAQV